MRFRISDLGFRYGALTLRGSLLLAGLSLALFATACKKQAESESGGGGSCCGATSQPDSRPIVFGVNDPFCDKTGSPCVGKGHYRSYDGLVKGIGKATGRRIELRYFATEPLLIAAARAGELNGVICKAWPALLAARAARRKLERLADLSMPVTSGPDRLEGIIFVRADSPIKTLKGLAGKRLAIGDPDSYEKSFTIRRMLAASGVKPEFVRKATCLSAALAVKEGETDAAVLSSYAYLYGTLEAVEMPRVREIARTGPIPFITVGVFDTMDAAARSQLRNVLGAYVVSESGHSLVPPPADLGDTRITRPVEWTPAELNSHE
ncbi:MAG: PhnD/SsuA/transferrin family substrate-binding protein [Phycisphaerae bacterium]|nr:PhnD/SsuA/transferrin family substrate-binding protein [Phycisphaerae bacterium]